MVNQEQFVARLQKTADERMLLEQESERTLKERKELTT